MDQKLKQEAKRLAEAITTNDAHARSLNQAEQRLLARAFLASLNVDRVNGVEYTRICQCDGSVHELGMGCG